MYPSPCTGHGVVPRCRMLIAGPPHRVGTLELCPRRDRQQDGIWPAEKASDYKASQRISHHGPPSRYWL